MHTILLTEAKTAKSTSRTCESRSIAQVLDAQNVDDINLILGSCYSNSKLALMLF